VVWAPNEVEGKEGKRTDGGKREREKWEAGREGGLIHPLVIARSATDCA